MTLTKRQEAEEFLQHAFGETSLREHQASSVSPFPKAYIAEAIAVIERSGAAALLAQWRQEDEIQTRGRKAYIPMESALVIMLMHLREGRGLLFPEMAATLAYRLTDEQLLRIGITPRPLNQHDWYNCLIRCVDRLIGLIDAYPGPRRALLKDGAYIKVLESRDPVECEKKRARAARLANQIVRGSVELLHGDVFDLWKGNIAFDATFFALSGKEGNPSSDNNQADRQSTNYDGGWYTRGGDHDGDAAKRRDKHGWGLELETMTTTANAPGESATFPLLTLTIDYHKPGAIKGAGKRLLDEMRRRNYPVGHVMCDRAYMPGAMPHELQGPFLDAGYLPVFDYGIKDHGQQAHYEHAVLVMGSWYVSGMPTVLKEAEMLHTKTMTALRAGDVAGDKGLKEALKLVKGRERQLVTAEMHAVARRAADARTSERAVAEQLLKDRREERATYRLSHKGKRRPDGSQQYSYPDPNTYVLVDEVSGELLPPLKKATVVIPREVGLKYVQPYLHLSPKWTAWYGLRNTVEGSYSHAKDVMKEDLGNAAKRRKRGNTFAFLAAALAIASANVRKIVDWIARHASEVTINSKNRHSFGLDAEITSERKLTIKSLDPPPRE